MAERFQPGSVAIFHFVQPAEKLWGVVERIAPAGVTLRGLQLSTFEEWMREIARGDEPSLGLATLFVPMHRVERIFLDEQVGAVESYRQRFERTVGRTVEGYLGLDDPAPR